MSYVHRYRRQVTLACFSKELLVLRTERIVGWAALRWIRQETLLSATVLRAAASIRRSVIPVGRQAIRRARSAPKAVCWRVVILKRPAPRDGENTQPCASIRATTAHSGTPT